MSEQLELFSKQPESRWVTVWVVTRTDKSSPRYIRRTWAFQHDPTNTALRWMRACTKSIYKIHVMEVKVP